MAVAPEPYLSACVQVLHRSVLWCRVWGWKGDVPAEHLADLKDAIHHIPELITNWERCDLGLLRGMLGEYEARWIDRGGPALRQIFDKLVAGEVV